MSILRRLDWAAIILLSLFGVFVFAPNLFFGQVFSGEEQIGFYYVISHYVGESLQAGLPLNWIGNYYGGLPASLDQFVGSSYPLNRFLFSWLDFFTAHHLSMTFATIAGLLLSYWFGRAQHWSRSASISLALLYFLATTYGWLLIGTTAAHSFAILPALLLAVYSVSKRCYTLAILGGSFALGIGFLAGFVQIVFYNYVIAGLYALFLDWSQYDRARSIVHNLTTSLSYTAVTVGGLIIGFPQFYPSVALIESSIRTSTYAIQNATIAAPTELIALILPSYFSIPFLGGGSSAGFYIGTIGVICALLALSYYRTRTILFFAGVYALIAAFAFHFFPFSWINEHLPPFSRMGGNFRWIVSAAFPLAYLGAAGIEGFLKHPEMLSRPIKTTIIAICVTISGLLVIGSLSLSFITARIATSPKMLERLISWYTQGQTLSFPPEHYSGILTQTLRHLTETFSLSNPLFLVGTLWWLGAALFFWWSFRTRHHNAIPIVLVGFVVTLSMSVVALQWKANLVPQKLYTEEPALVRILKELESEQHTYRVFGYLLGDGAYLQFFGAQTSTPEQTASIHMQTLINNTNLYFDIDRMDGMAPYRSLRHNQLLNTVIVHDWATWVFDDENPRIETEALDQLYNRDVQKQVSIEEKLLDLPQRIPLLSMMNATYIYSPYQLHDPRLQRVATVPVDIGTTTPYSLYLYKNSSALPRVYLASSVHYAESGHDAFLRVIRTGDFARTTIIECSECANILPGTGAISIEHYENGYIVLSVDAHSDTWLIVSESAFPGWSASIDGEERPIYAANYIFQALQVPAGRHTIHFEYHDIAAQALQSVFGQ